MQTMLGETRINICAIADVFFFGSSLGNFYPQRCWLFTAFQENTLTFECSFIQI
jgi:uncharacterized SAM-dependent methyltransferase